MTESWSWGRIASVVVLFAAAIVGYLVANAEVYRFGPITLANLGLAGLMLSIAANLLPTVTRQSNRTS